MQTPKPPRAFPGPCTREDVRGPGQLTQSPLAADSISGVAAARSFMGRHAGHGLTSGTPSVAEAAHSMHCRWRIKMGIRP